MPRKPSTAKKADSTAAKRKTARKPIAKTKAASKTKVLKASDGIAAASVAEQPKAFHGNTTVYTRELADEICERISNGETLRQVCRLKDIPASTVRRWVVNDIDGFSARYTHARELCIESWADEVVEIGEDGRNDWMTREGKDGDGTAYAINGEHVTRSRLRVDSRKWLLSKLRPDKYGDKLQVGGDPNGASISHKHDIAFVIVDPAAT